MIKPIWCTCSQKDAGSMIRVLATSSLCFDLSQCKYERELSEVGEKEGNMPSWKPICEKCWRERIDFDIIDGGDKE